MHNFRFAGEIVYHNFKQGGSTENTWQDKSGDQKNWAEDQEREHKKYNYSKTTRGGKDQSK